MLSSISIILYMRIDQVMIKNMLGDSELGIYSVAVKIAELPNFIPVIISASVFPAIISYRKNKKLYNLRLQQLYNVFSLISISIALVISIFSPFIIWILFWNQYSGASVILSIYIWSIVPVFLWVASGKYLLTENLTDISLYRTLIWAIMNVILNIILIPIYGWIWAAVSTVVSYTISVYIIIIIKKTRKNWLLLVKGLNIFYTIKNLQKILWDIYKK